MAIYTFQSKTGTKACSELRDGGNLPTELAPWTFLREMSEQEFKNANISQTDMENRGFAFYKIDVTSSEEEGVTPPSRTE